MLDNEPVGETACDPQHRALDVHLVCAIGELDAVKEFHRTIARQTRPSRNQTRDLERGNQKLDVA